MGKGSVSAKPGAPSPRCEGQASPGLRPTPSYGRPVCAAGAGETLRSVLCRVCRSGVALRFPVSPSPQEQAPRPPAPGQTAPPPPLRPCLGSVSAERGDLVPGGQEDAEVGAPGGGHTGGQSTGRRVAWGPSGRSAGGWSGGAGLPLSAATRPWPLAHFGDRGGKSPLGTSQANFSGAGGWSWSVGRTWLRSGKS